MTFNPLPLRVRARHHAADLVDGLLYLWNQCDTIPSQWLAPR
jgi:hypothetical protein